ncbi:cytochrome o ubiquinol oxidase subunit IV [Zobellella sp. DQSA1]|uniref:cytochrome o ubiquinol oxidase subunit IV n=1 Tax=Zobellella sp. DQSA1 TaxID=3342386 RepID=UPI0035C21F8D
MSQQHDAGHGSVKSYLSGFVWSVILTAIPFWAVMTESLSMGATLAVVVGLAVVQLVVHLKYFLHLDFSPGGRDNTVAFLFTVLVIVMVVGLSVWIILSANAMMMY